VSQRATKVADGLPLLIEATRQYVDRMIGVAELWRPDLVVHSQLQGGGPLAAAKLGVPAVEHGSSLLRTGDFYEHLAELMPETFTTHGLTRLPRDRVTLDVAPPSMVAEMPGSWPMRYIPFNGGGLLPDTLADRPDRPRIAVTIGTNIMAPNMADLLGRTFAAAGDVGAEFVVLLSGLTDQVDLGRVPANVRIVTHWLPLRSLLDTCTAILHHGGAGSILASLDAGVTQLVVPSGAPNYLQSDAVRERGVGVTASAEEVDAALVRRVLDDEKMRRAAADVRDEIARMPTPVDLVPRLAALTRT
jgi:UDP:flavonoid glycosyltransferase YjiC (YdhE family)